MISDGPVYKFFRSIADPLVAAGADDATIHDVLSVLMDHIGVPMMCAQRYRHVPAIRALFAERGVILLDTTDDTVATRPGLTGADNG